MADELENQELEQEPITPVDEPIQEPTDTPEDIARAQRMGWIPKDQFKGDVSKWRPAKDFLEIGEQILPILRERNIKLDGALEKTQAELSEIKKGQQEFIKYTREQAKREYELKLSELQAKKDEAFDAGDKEAFLETEKQIAKLEKPPDAPKPDTATGIIPELQPWFDRNSHWYGKDKFLTQQADIIVDAIRLEVEEETGKPFSGEPLLEKVRERLEQLYPKRFDNPARQHAAPVGGAGGNPTGGSGNKGKSFANLPREAQELCNNMVKNGYMTREEYLRDYDWS